MEPTEQNEAILDQPFEVLRQELATQTAPPGVEKELMAAFARQHPKRRWYHRLTRAQWGMAGGLGSTAMVVLVFAVSLQAPVRLGVSETGHPLVYRDEGAAFIALDSLERIESEPAPQVVQADLPRTALASIGVPVSPENAGDTVHAELIVAGDGQPLAVRLSAAQ